MSVDVIFLPLCEHEQTNSFTFVSSIQPTTRASHFTSTRFADRIFPIGNNYFPLSKVRITFYGLFSLVGSNRYPFSVHLIVFSPQSYRNFFSCPNRIFFLRRRLGIIPCRVSCVPGDIATPVLCKNYFVDPPSLSEEHGTWLLFLQKPSQHAREAPKISTSNIFRWGWTNLFPRNTT